MNLLLQSTDGQIAGEGDADDSTSRQTDDEQTIERERASERTAAFHPL